MLHSLKISIFNFAGLKELDFVFLIQLRYVSTNTQLHDIVISQHERLENVDHRILSNILHGNSNYNVLLLLDGYDEYTPGTNANIDKVITQGTGNCFTILTSRPGFLDKTIRDKFDAEVKVEGFNKEQMEYCAFNYLQNNQKATELVQQAKTIGIDDLLRIPIVLLMTCVVYDEKQKLPERKTELLGTLFELMMDRTTIKQKFDRKSRDIENIDTLLQKLGEFSWKSLQQNVMQLLLNKVRLLHH